MWWYPIKWGSYPEGAEYQIFAYERYFLCFSFLNRLYICDISYLKSWVFCIIIDILILIVMRSEYGRLRKLTLFFFFENIFLQPSHWNQEKISIAFALMVVCGVSINRYKRIECNAHFFILLFSPKRQALEFLILLFRYSDALHSAIWFIVEAYWRSLLKSKMFKVVPYDILIWFRAHSVAKHFAFK